MNRIINNHLHKEKRKLLRKKETDTEQVIWNIIRNRKLGYKWKRQVSIGRYVADFYCREKMIVLEVDGMYHENTIDYDTERTNYFSSLGIATLRLWNYDIINMSTAVKNKIITALEAAPLSFKERGRG